MENVFGSTSLVDKQGNTIAPSALSSKKVVGLYFSAHWCPPCRGFTPILAKAYKTIVDSGKSFEVVFISSDQSDAQFNEYYAEMPWITLPFSARAEKASLSSKFGVNGIPTLILLDGATGKVISTEGRSIITKDQSGNQFPWENASAGEGGGGGGGCAIS